MNLKKIEKIAAELEKKLGIDEAGDELIDKAEDAVAHGDDTLPEMIEDRNKEEKVNSDNPIVTEPAPLEASDNDIDSPNDEINEVDNAINDIKDTENLNNDNADLESKLDNDEPAEAPVEESAEAPTEAPAEESDDDIPVDKEDAKAFIASLKRLIRIAKAVKMSKDMPATKKADVLGKIQKASEKLRNATGAGVSEEDAEENEHPAIQSFISIFNSKRGKLNSIMKGRGKGNQRIRSLLGQDFDNKMVGTMTLAELFRTMSSILNKLK